MALACKVGLAALLLWWSSVAAATCPPLSGTGMQCPDQQAGQTSPSSPAGHCGFFFKSATLLGNVCQPVWQGNTAKLEVCSAEKPLLGGGWNDSIQSFYLAEDAECIATQDSNFSGNFVLLLPCRSLTGPNVSMSYEAGRTGPYPRQYSFNLKATTSIKCGPAGYFTQNTLARGRADVFEHVHFAGRSMSLSASSNIAYIGSEWNDRISSIKVGPGLKCTLFDDRDFRGTSIVVGPSQAIFSLVTKSFSDKVSSIRCVAA